MSAISLHRRGAAEENNFPKLFSSPFSLNKMFSFVIKAVSKKPWPVTIGALGTVGIAFTLASIHRARRLRKKTTAHIDFLISNLTKIEERKLMELHTDIEDIIVELEAIIKESKDYYVFRPVHIQYRNILKDFQKIERLLFSHLYPDYNKELSAEEQQEIVEAFKPWQEDSQKVLEHG